MLVGGAIKKKPFTAENAEMLAEAILNVHNQVSGSILITSSRRTGKEAEDIIMKKIGHIPAYTYLWGEKKDNPIMGFYACADRIIVTGDSVSMACEACGSGKPVLVFRGKNWLTPKHQRFVQSLYEGGFAVDIDGYDTEQTGAMKRLDPALEIGEKIKACFDKSPFRKKRNNGKKNPRHIRGFFICGGPPLIQTFLFGNHHLLIHAGRKRWFCARKTLPDCGHSF